MLCTGHQTIHAQCYAIPHYNKNTIPHYNTDTMLCSGHQTIHAQCHTIPHHATYKTPDNTCTMLHYTTPCYVQDTRQYMHNATLYTTLHTGHQTIHAQCYTVPHHATYRTPDNTCTMLHYTVYHTTLRTGHQTTAAQCYTIPHYSMYRTAGYTSELVSCLNHPARGSSRSTTLHHATLYHITIQTLYHTTLCTGQQATHQDLFSVQTIEQWGAAVPVHRHAVQFDQLERQKKRSALIITAAITIIITTSESDIIISTITINV